MKDINSALTKKLYDMLSPVVGVPVYSNYVPSHINPDAYILLTAINNNDTSTMHSADTDTTIQIGIYTRDSQANPGVLKNSLASIIYETLYPTTGTTIDLEPDFQVLNFRLANDTSPNAFVTNNEVYLNRFLTFKMSVYHRA